MTEQVFALADARAYTGTGHAPPEVFSGSPDGKAMPATAHKAVSSFQEAAVEKTWQAKEGRPSAAESRDRTSRFLCLIAEGHNAEDAAKAAKIGPWRALRIVTESDFLEIVRALRSGAEPVTLIATEAKAA